MTSKKNGSNYPSNNWKKLFGVLSAEVISMKLWVEDLLPCFFPCVSLFEGLLYDNDKRIRIYQDLDFCWCSVHICHRSKYVHCMSVIFDCFLIQMFALLFVQVFYRRNQATTVYCVVENPPPPYSPRVIDNSANSFWQKNDSRFFEYFSYRHQTKGQALRIERGFRWAHRISVISHAILTEDSCDVGLPNGGLRLWSEFIFAHTYRKDQPKI
jgi:hypothetical protein